MYSSFYLSSMVVGNYWYLGSSACSGIPRVQDSCHKFLGGSCAALRRKIVLDTIAIMPQYNDTRTILDIAKLPHEDFIMMDDIFRYDDIFNYIYYTNQSREILSFSLSHTVPTLNCVLYVFSDPHFNQYAHSADNLFLQLDILLSAALYQPDPQLLNLLQSDSYMQANALDALLYISQRTTKSIQEYAKLFGKVVEVFAGQLEILSHCYERVDLFLLQAAIKEHLGSKKSLTELMKSFEGAGFEFLPIGESLFNYVASDLTLDEIKHLREKFDAANFVKAFFQNGVVYSGFSREQVELIIEIVSADIRDNMIPHQELNKLLSDLAEHVCLEANECGNYYPLLLDGFLSNIKPKGKGEVDSSSYLQLLEVPNLSPAAQKYLISGAIGDRNIFDFLTLFGVEPILKYTNYQRFIELGHDLSNELLERVIDNRGASSTAKQIVTGLNSCFQSLMSELNPPSNCKLLAMNALELQNAIAQLQSNPGYTASDILIATLMGEIMGVVEHMGVEPHHIKVGAFGFAPVDLVSLLGVGDFEMIDGIIEYLIQDDRITLSHTLSTGEGELGDFIIFLNNHLKFAHKIEGKLYSLLSDEANASVIDPQSINIAISHGEGYWSNNYLVTARSLKAKMPDYEFYLVTDKFLTNNPRALDLFDGIINPGASDSYPDEAHVFSKQGGLWQPKLQTEVIFLKALSLAEARGIPTLGACAGYQNLALYKGSYLKPISGYGFGTHEITIKPATMIYFYSLDKQQKIELLTEGSAPPIKYNAITAHSYVPVRELLAAELELGAVSEHGEAMAACDDSGIHCGTQYHPEYGIILSNSDPQMKPQYNFIKSFLEMASFRHHNRTGNSEYEPTDITEIVQYALQNEVCPLDLSWLA